MLRFFRENAAAVQALASIAALAVATVLVCVTRNYAKSTRDLAASTEGLAKSTEGMARSTEAMVNATKASVAEQVQQRNMYERQLNAAGLEEIRAATNDLDGAAAASKHTRELVQALTPWMRVMVNRVYALPLALVDVLRTPMALADSLLDDMKRRPVAEPVARYQSITHRIVHVTLTYLDEYWRHPGVALDPKVASEYLPELGSDYEEWYAQQTRDGA